ncbi:hypothetical protein ACOSQ4_003956 [Xanthoceras sorbifolium]
MDADSDLPAGSSIFVDEISRRDGFDGVSMENLDNQDNLKKRKTVPSWTEKVRVSHGNELQAPLDDGYSWRKYRQKDILGAKYPRSYYRCTYRNTRALWLQSKCKDQMKTPQCLRSHTEEHTLV